MSKYAVLFGLFVLSCKQHVQTAQRPLESDTKVLQQEHTNLAKKSSDSQQFYKLKRQPQESVEDFVNRSTSIILGTVVIKGLNHPVIVSENWINNLSTVLVFFNVIENGSENVKGYVFFSENKMDYQVARISTFYPEGQQATVKSVFFANADEDLAKELVVLVSWRQQLYKEVDGQLYKVTIFDDINDLKENSLPMLQQASDLFDLIWNLMECNKEIG